MKDYDVVPLGVARVAPTTNVPLAQCVGPVADDGSDAEPYGELAMMCALGVTALPAEPEGNKTAEGVVLRNAGGLDGVLIGARDVRSTEIVGQLKPGETALHSTGKDFGSAVMVKDGVISLYIKKKGSGGIKKDTVLVMNRETEQVTISAFGHVFELSEQNGIAMCAKLGKASISIKGDTIWLKADKVLIGGNPVLPAASGPGMSTIDSVSVKISP